MISENTILAVKDAARIEEVVTEFVTLKKSGSGYTACCPFHAERSPSFNVSPAKNMFKCFGCGEGGDSITFVMRQTGKTYPEAIRYLAHKYHIEVEEISQKPDPQHDEKVQARTTAAALQAHFSMVKPDTLKYWIDRGFTAETLDEFGVGYCDGTKPANISDELLKQIGAINDGGNITMYKRTTIPIHDRVGNVVGWGGRALNNEKDTAKYINSPDTIIYSKLNTLFNLHRATPYIRQRQEIWIVEGYADAMALWQMGIRNVVALCGTALTPSQSQIIAKFNGERPLRIFLCMDNETTKGKETYKKQVAEAAKNILQTLLEHGEVRRILYPKGCKDVADILAAGHPIEGIQRADALKLFVQETATKDWRETSSPVEQADFQDVVARMLANIKKDNVRSIYINDLSTELGISSRDLDRMVKGFRTEQETEEKNRVANEFRYIKVGDEYYQRMIEYDIFTKSSSVVYRRRKRQELCSEGVEITKVERFHDWLCEPSHLKYRRIIEIPHEGETFKFFNSYQPLPYKPKEFELPEGFTKNPEGFDYEDIPEIKHTAAFMKHIFGWDSHRWKYLTLGWDWLSICYLNPTQRLQALCLVSSEEGNGKSTFINLVLSIFGQNATKTEASRIGGNFNAMSGGKVIQCVEETKDERGDIENKLKDLITAYEKVVEAKHQDARVVKSFDKYIFASNHEEGFMKVGTETTRFAVMKVPAIKNKVPDFEEKLYLEIPYLLYFMQKRGIITPKEDRLHFNPKLWENEALLKLRHASKDQVQQVMEELIQSIFLRCELTDPVIYLSSQYLKLLMVAYGGKSYEQKTPVYFQNVATKDMRLKYNEMPTNRDTIELMGIHADSWVNQTSWGFEKKKTKSRFIEVPIWRFCTPAEIRENYTQDRIHKLIELTKKINTPESIDWANTLEELVGEGLPF